MNAHQRCRRTVFWRGSFTVILGFAVLSLAMMLADQSDPASAQELDGVNLGQQIGHSQKLGGQATAPILAASE